MLLFWSYVARRRKLYWLFLLLTLGIKESTAILGAAFGLTIMLSDRQRRSMGLATLVISAAWGLTAIRLVIPFFSGKPYGYSPVLPDDLMGNIIGLFNEAIKRKTLLYSFGSFLFLPLLYPPAWLLFLQDFFVRFVPKDTNLRWDLGLHYSAQLAPILAYATVMALKKFHRPVLGVLLIGVAIYLHQFKLHGPLGLAYNRAFYAHTKNFAFLDKLVLQVPKGATVMAQNNLATRFTRQTVYLLRKNYPDYRPDYIVIDARDGQNPNNFFGIKDYQGIGDVEAIIATLQSDPLYETAYKTQKQFVFRKKTP